MPSYDLFDPDEVPEPSSQDPMSPALRALALAWGPRHSNWLLGVLRAAGARMPTGRQFNKTDLDAALKALAERALVVHDVGGWRCADPHRVALARQALRLPDHPQWRSAVLEVDGVRLGDRHGWLSSSAPVATAARMLFYGGEPLAAWQALERFADARFDWELVTRTLMLEGFDPELIAGADPVVSSQLMSTTLSYGMLALDPTTVPVFLAARDGMEARGSGPDALVLRAMVAETQIVRGEPQAALATIAALRGDQLGVVRAAADAVRGRWEEAIAGFEATLAALRKSTGLRKGLLPGNLVWLYPMCLFASRDTARIVAARKFCAAESGAREPQLHAPWGPWVHAADIRLGDRPARADFLRPPDRGRIVLSLESVERRMLQAWTHAGAGAHPDPGSSAELRERLAACGFDWLLAQVEAADRVLAGEAPATPFFASGGGERWREALSAIAALGSSAPQDPASGAGETQLVWLIEVDGDGRLRSITPAERKRGARGWGKPRAIALSRLAKTGSLDPWDSRIARAIRELRSYGGKHLVLDLDEAATALAGHPRVAFQDAPDLLVAVTDEAPELRLVEEGGAWRLEFVPDLTALLRQGEGGQALPIMVERTGDGSARLIRMSPAQRRVAELAAAGLRVPAEALPELQAVLPVLSTHFRMKAGAAQAALRSDAEPRLRAELAPLATGLRLRLVAAPLGPTGPRLAPGAGRADLFAPIDGRLRACERRLADEREALAAVLGAFAFLDPPTDPDAPPEWELPEAREALALVERLDTLDAIAGVDWPKGRPIQVLPAASGQLRVKVDEDRGWFALSGGLRIDEREVLELSQLIELIGRHRSRYVPLDDGRWIALSERLRQQVEDLAAVTERARGGRLRAPAPTAAWLEGALADASVEGDGALDRRLAALQASMTLEPALPPTLQAELRPYQREGFVWMMQRAAAGFGACLADDMGLGKTLQSLAVLLARADLGPALVVAPTSVCPNWLDEARRFAPSLRAQAWTQELDLGAMSAADVVLVSYTTLQLNAERFAARQWATLVADEAQSIKNTSAKRTQAIMAVPADLRIALSGTPIENRLGELWSIMGFTNPGLLGSAERFAQRFVRPIERERDLRAQRTLRRLIAPFVLRRTKAQVLDDLPPRTETTLTVTPGAREAAHYESLRREALAAATKAVEGAAAAQGQFHVLAQLTRLRRAACDPRLVSPELGLVGAKVAAFAELAAEIVANGHKALVFSQFVDFLGLLREAADAQGLRCQYLDGATPAGERARRIVAFQGGDGDLFLISLKAGGFGLNLTAADYVIIVDPWWNPAAEDQASGRAHRIGQARPVTVYRLVTEGSIEERIARLHHDKRALADGILEGAETAAPPDTAELLALMRGD